LNRPRILIVSRNETEKARRASESLRFGKMVEALSAGGLHVKHVTPSSFADYQRNLATIEPDMAFCSFFRFSGQGAGGGDMYDTAINEGVAWIGSPSGTMEMALSKSRMKAHWRLCGIPTPDWFIMRKLPDGSTEGSEQIENAQSFPYIVKPVNEGNSRGIDEGSVVHSPMELRARAGLIMEKYGEALVERFVSGGVDSREFTVAMVGNGPDAIVSPVEIKKANPASTVITENDKELQTTKLLPVEEGNLKSKIISLALRIFMSSEVRDYARCDILLHERKLYAIEMNGQPMVPDRWFEACSREVGLDDVQYINAIVLAGIASNARTGHADISIPREMTQLLPQRILERLTI
jgi:D-alanine-D-alanine ligase